MQLSSRFTNIHWIILTVFLFFSALLSYPVASKPSDSYSRRSATSTVLRTAGMTISGPLAGAIARDWQSCCQKFSFGVLPYSAVLLLVGVGMQFARASWVSPRVAMTLWVIGLVGWFGGILVSYAHALS